MYTFSISGNKEALTYEITTYMSVIISSHVAALTRENMSVTMFHDDRALCVLMFTLNMCYIYFWCQKRSMTDFLDLYSTYGVRRDYLSRDIHSHCDLVQSSIY